MKPSFGWAFPFPEPHTLVLQPSQPPMVIPHMLPAFRDPLSVLKEAAVLGLKFAHLIERHSKGLSESLVHQLHSSDRTPSFHKIAAEDLHEDVHELYLHLTEWLVTRTEGDVQERQQRIGAYRAEQNIPIEEFLWAVILCKRNILDYLKRETVADAPYELAFELEFMQSLDEFFDRAIYHAICGYVQQQGKQHVHDPHSHAHA